MQQNHRAFHGKRAILVGTIVFVAIVGALAALGVINVLTTYTHASHQSTKMLALKVTVTTIENAAKSASSHPAKMIPVKVTAYTLEGKMTDGKETHVGACAVSTAQFPLGSVIYLYNPDGTFNRQCVAEDTGPSIGNGEIDLAMPGDEASATRWGTRNLLARVMRWGWDNATPQANTTP